jgi:hypothetical protein
MLRIRLAGATVGLGGKGVWFSGPEPLPKSLLAKARQHRDDIVKVLKAETVPAQSAALHDAAAMSDAVARVAECSLEWSHAPSDPRQPADHDSPIVDHSIADLRHPLSWRRAEAHPPAPGATRSCRGRGNRGRAMNEGGVARLAIQTDALAGTEKRSYRYLITLTR